jgi:quercetin dioxygenase-like cupin family protein
MIKNISNVEHYQWGTACDGWRLLGSPSLTVIQERMPPHATETIHYHINAQQFFFILKGSLTFEVEKEVFVVKEGQGFHIVLQTIHKVMNNSEEDVHFLVISEPSTKGDRVNL